ncbi:hypothetical protein H2198_005752 [Neophaeococcomyces mojaviensis]|uniref:Uncharacterized protein n=1 Tax=Neophaeococcomyces mojaviensis TaxID=3383035 RepID=A0ACC3A4U0_9EURO|nr:hypothetical protein H2198_005752 [Knufia sp. JES_112]
MTSGRFKAYNPDVGSSYYPRRTNDEWDQHRQILTRMHNNHFPRRQMIRALRLRGFEVSPSQLASQLKKWNLTAGARSTMPEVSGDDAQQYLSAVDGPEDASDNDTYLISFNTFSPPRRGSPSQNEQQSNKSNVGESGTAADQAIKVTTIPQPAEPTAISDRAPVGMCHPEPPAPVVDTTENTPKDSVDGRKTKLGPMLRRRQALHDLTELLLQDIDFQWDDTTTDEASRMEKGYPEPISLDPTTLDASHPTRFAQPSESDTDRPSTSSDNASNSDTLFSEKNKSTGTSTCVNDPDSPMQSPSSLHLYPDYESVFGSKFSNVDTDGKPRTTISDQATSSPKLYSLKLRDRIAKNSPEWNSSFDDMASTGAIIRHLSTITEPWCTSFPTTCCCHSLFFAKDDFAQSPELYMILMEQSPIYKLQFVMALLSLVETRPKGSHKEVLKTRLRETVEFYLKQCTRTDVKNTMASTILHRLLKVSESILGGEYSATSRLSTRSLSSTSLQTSALMEKILKTTSLENRGTGDDNMPTKWFQECADNAITLDFAGLCPNKFSSLNRRGQNFGNRPWALHQDESSSTLAINDSVEDHTTEYPRPIFDGTFLMTTAASIAKMLQQQHASVPVKGVSSHGPSDSKRIFSALGLMIALEFSTNVSFLYEAPGPISDPAFWTSQMHKFVYTFIENLGQDAECADKFRKAYWLARTDMIGRDGKGIHTGQCKAAKEWTILDRSIHEFDEDRPWIERQFLAHRLTLPHDNEIVMGDHMSIHSESSATSFDRFQATAVRLQLGRLPSTKSFQTSSSKRMSAESHLSWQLDRLLEISDDGPMDVSLTDEQRAEQDQRTFDLMQTIAE